MFSKKEVGGFGLMAVVVLILNLAFYAAIICLVVWLLRALNVIG